MSKITEYLLELSFIAVLLRCLAFGATMGDAVICISLVISITYKNYYIIKNKIDDKEEIYKQLEDLKSAITSVKLNAGLTRKTNEKEAIIPGRRF
jgi:hypothetical protein